MKSIAQYRESIPEEISNAITHGLGALASIAGLILLLLKANGPYQIISFSIFGASLILLYSASTLYHAIQKIHIKRVLNLIDHSSIYLLIAGTYTPFTLVSMRGPWGWSIFGVIWGLAIGGIVLKFFTIGKHRILSTLLYVGMGWIIVIAIRPLLANLDMQGVWLIIAGGISYSMGIVFYLIRRIPFGHSIWHLFVLGGSVCHYLAIYWYVG